MGRRTHWKQQNDDRVSCRYWHHTILSNSTHMEKHLRNDCPEVPEGVKHRFQAEDSSTPPLPRYKQMLLIASNSPSSLSSASSSISQQSPTTVKRMRCANIDRDADDTVLIGSSSPMSQCPESHDVVVHGSNSPKESRQHSHSVDTITTQQRAIANRKLAAFVFTCNIPFAVVDHPRFRDFVRFIRPAYEKNIPHRTTVSLQLNV